MRFTISDSAHSSRLTDSGAGAAHGPEESVSEILSGRAAPRGLDNFETDALAASPSEAQGSAVSDCDWRAAQSAANLCEEFSRLLATGAHSLRTAATALGRSPSWFSGPASPYARWRRGGAAALLPQRRAAGAKVKFHVPDWFVPAARFFYLLSNRTWETGSVPEAVRRVLSLPTLPIGWDASIKRRFLTSVLGSKFDVQIPICPPELRELLLQRERAGRPFVPERLRRLITARPAVVRQHRNPTESALDFLNSPGGMRLVDGRLARAGEIFEADDATVNFPVCVPWQRDGSDDPCVRKYGVKVARFQWLVAIDAGTSYVPGFSYTARPRSSYRAEDVLSLFRLVARQHCVPAQWRLEQGVWKSRLVVRAVEQMGSRLRTVYSPHQKPFIEGLFNVLWTKLSIQFPDGHVGRFRGEDERANDLLTACQRGHKDPRRHFPMLATAIAAFHEVIAEKNRTPVTTAGHGRWVPEERWLAELDRPPLDPAADWLFAPFVREWTVKGMLVGGRVPMFQDVSVPFDFSADFLPDYHGARVRCHFDPADPHCTAKLVLAEMFHGEPAGKILGDAKQVNDTAGYVRMVMGWAAEAAVQGSESSGNAGRAARQAAAAALRREVRAILPRGQRGAALSEVRDGLGSSARLESAAATPSPGGEGRGEGALKAPTPHSEFRTSNSRGLLAAQAARANRLRELSES